MNKPSDNTDLQINDTTFENFITGELLPMLGVSRKSFDQMLGQLVSENLSDQMQNGLHSFAVDTYQCGASWGSLYSALYQENAIPHCAGLKAGRKTNPARNLRVTSGVKDFLDIAFPLTEGSHHEVTSYLVYFQNLMMILADGSTAGLQNPSQFVAKIGRRDNPESILLLQNGMHVELSFDRSGEIGSRDLAGINDVQIESIETARSNLKADSAAEKCERYRQLMITALSAQHAEAQLTNNSNTEFTSKNGDLYQVNNQGHVVYVATAEEKDHALITDGNTNPLPSKLVDTFIASLIAASVNRCRSNEAAGCRPRIIVASENAELTLRVLNLVEKACKRSRTAVTATTDLASLQKLTEEMRSTQGNVSAAATRAESGELNRSAPNLSDNKIHPVSHNKKSPTAESSINQAVLCALHHHGFELARLSRDLPGSTRLGEQTQPQIQANA